MAPKALKGVCRYEGEASKLRSALERCGFIDVDGEAISVHGWAETNAKLIANWENGKKGGRPKKVVDMGENNPAETQLEPNANPSVTQRNPTRNWGNPNETDKSRVDKSNEINKYTHARNLSRPDSIEEVLACIGIPEYKMLNKADAMAFYDHYEAQGWIAGNNVPISNWRAKLRSWQKDSGRVNGSDHRKQSEASDHTPSTPFDKAVQERGHFDPDKHVVPDWQRHLQAFCKAYPDEANPNETEWKNLFYEAKMHIYESHLREQKRKRKTENA
jgi:hypothetical protein